MAPGNGIPPKVKHMMVATVALPKLEREKGDQIDPEVEMDEAQEGDLFSHQAEAGEDEAEENQGGDHKAAEELNQKWLEHAKRLSEPVGVQNLTMVEPLASRHQSDVARVAARLYSRYRALGVGVLRIHTDRETAFLSRHFQAWCQRIGVWQTLTGGDEGPSNGRIESEVQQVKRRSASCSVVPGWTKSTGPVWRGTPGKRGYGNSWRPLVSQYSRFSPSARG